VDMWRNRIVNSQKQHISGAEMSGPPNKGRGRWARLDINLWRDGW